MAVIILDKYPEYTLIKYIHRSRRNRSRVRRYDILSAKQLQPDLIIESDDSEDELFERDDVTRQLVQQQQQPTTGNLPSRQ